MVVVVCGGGGDGGKRGRDGRGSTPEVNPSLRWAKWVSFTTAVDVQRSHSVRSTSFGRRVGRAKY